MKQLNIDILGIGVIKWKDGGWGRMSYVPMSMWSHNTVLGQILLCKYGLMQHLTLVSQGTESSSPISSSTADLYKSCVFVIK
jgi:hypothetical protein